MGRGETREFVSAPRLLGSRKTLQTPREPGAAEITQSVCSERAGPAASPGRAADLGPRSPGAGPARFCVWVSARLTSRPPPTQSWSCEPQPRRLPPWLGGAETRPSVSTSHKEKKMFNTSGPALPPHPRHSLALSLSFLPFHFAASGVAARSGGADVGGLPPLPGSETPQFLSCVSPSLPVFSALARSLSPSLSVRGIKKIATSIMNFCSLSLLSTVPGILR